LSHKQRKYFKDFRHVNYKTTLHVPVPAEIEEDIWLHTGPKRETENQNTSDNMLTSDVVKKCSI
jgi:hypothetical protein